MHFTLQLEGLAVVCSIVLHEMQKGHCFSFSGHEVCQYDYLFI